MMDLSQVLISLEGELDWLETEDGFGLTFWDSYKYIPVKRHPMLSIM